MGHKHKERRSGPFLSRAAVQKLQTLLQSFRIEPVHGTNKKEPACLECNSKVIQRATPPQKSHSC